MNWYHYFAAFWAGMFFSNFVPHFIKGVSGDFFPTPFAKPSGKGMSSPAVNVAWALFNLVVACLLFKVSKISTDNYLAVLICFIGFAFLSFFSAKNFVNKDKI